MTALKGAFLLQIELWRPPMQYLHPTAAWHQNAASTTVRQLHALSSLQLFIKSVPEFKEVSLIQLINSFLTHRAINGRCTWLPQTFFREMTLLEGALSNLGKLTAQGLDLSIRLNVSPMSMKKAHTQVHMDNQPVHQAAANFEDMNDAIGRHLAKKFRR